MKPPPTNWLLKNYLRTILLKQKKSLKMSRKFTLEVQRIPQSSTSTFNELQFFHKECGSFRVIQAQLSSDAWALLCKRCKRKIIVKDNSTGNLPILKTAVDGEEREFVHETAKDTVLAKG